MITIEEINVALNEVKPLFVELQNLYDCLPETRCQCEQPGVCCAYLPEMTGLEALQWADVIQAMSAAARVKIQQRFIEFYLTNPIRHQGCPFLQNGACGVYERRPFACRAYGQWSSGFGKERTQKSRRDREALLQLWQKFGLELPPQMVQYEIDYCDKVHFLTDKVMSDIQLMDILQQIYRLDQALPGLLTIFEVEYHSDFSFLMTSLALDYRKAVLGKFAVIKEIVQQGTQVRLEQMLGKATAEALVLS